MSVGKGSECRVDAVRGAIRSHHRKAFTRRFRRLQTTRTIPNATSCPVRSLQTIASCSERSHRNRRDTVYAENEAVKSATFVPYEGHPLFKVGT